MSDTLFGAAYEPPPHRVEALAGVLAGFAYPGRGSLDRLTKKQRESVVNAAREALVRLHQEGGDE